MYCVDALYVWKKLTEEKKHKIPSPGETMYTAITHTQ